MSQMIAMTATIFMMVDSKEEVERLREDIAETLDGEFEAFQDIVFGPPIPVDERDAEVNIEDPGIFAKRSGL